MTRLNRALAPYLLAVLMLAPAYMYGQEQPIQPESGPGGHNYLHQKVTRHYTEAGAESYWVFEPDEPQPDSADLIVFNHGYAAYNPAMYGDWILHLVRKGNVVIFPRYQQNMISPPPSRYNEKATIAILNALEDLSQEGRVHPRLHHFSMVGHSYGGAITATLALKYREMNLPKPGAIMLCQPGTGGAEGGRAESFRNMEGDIAMLMIAGAKDVVVRDDLAREVFYTTEYVPFDRKNLIVHHKDKHGHPKVGASHREPGCWNDSLDSGDRNFLMLSAVQQTKTDAVDYYCYWKLFDALRDCIFYDKNCRYAFGNTPEQRFMGYWSDGQPVRELEVITE